VERAANDGPTRESETMHAAALEIDREAEAVREQNSSKAMALDVHETSLEFRQQTLRIALVVFVVSSLLVVTLWRRELHEDRRMRSLERDHFKKQLQIEAELRQAQKLEAVGLLAAGIAHDISTPLQFVNDTLHFLRDANPDLFAVIEALERVQRGVLEGNPSTDAAREAEERKETAEVSYLLEKIPKAMERALEGVARIAAIVRSMKDFSHPGSVDMTSVDLNRAIESTLIIASSEYKNVADVERDFTELPPVACYVGDINRVVLNILVNAAQAIGDVVKDGSERGRISVRTRRDGESVVIAIADTGGGIPEDVRDRIFDPFFTTKEVGKGTGQGLAMARKVVVDEHHGELSVESQVGKGTTFFIRLPIAPEGRQPNAGQA
jgi:two-component system NtrC family sensor kinase